MSKHSHEHGEHDDHQHGADVHHAAHSSAAHHAHTHHDHSHHEHKHAHEHDHDHDHNHAHHNHDEIVAPSGDPSAIPNDAKVVKLTLTAMDCPTEAALIRKAFEGQPAIHLLEFDLINRVLTVTHSLPNQSKIDNTLISIGLMENPAKKIKLSKQMQWAIFGLSGVLAIGSEVLDWLNMPSTFIAATALLAVLLAGTSTLKKGGQALKHVNLNINLLMSVAVIGALIIGQYPEAAVVIFLFTLAEKIEAASLGRARNAIAALQAHAPEFAQVLQADGTWQDTPNAQIKVGQTLRARPNERIALDGVVQLLDGQSDVHFSLNQAPITGESMPVTKTTGDTVYAGSLNLTGVLTYQVTNAAGSTTLDRIAKAVLQAQQQRAPTERMIDAFAKIYTPVVFIFALLMAIVPPLFLGAIWHDSIYKALVLLVIACPCALVISTPVTVVSALTYAARRGILVKGGQFLEQARHLKTIAFDKTGTLTVGKPSLHKVIALDDLGDDDCLQIAASLNALSQHPIASAMSKAWAAKNGGLLTVNDFKSLTGRGVSGQITLTSASNAYVLGNMRLMAEAHIVISDAIKTQLIALEQQGNTVILLAHTSKNNGQSNGQVLALFCIADSVRTSSQCTIAALKNVGVNSVMLTGDNQYAANAIAQQVGIDTVHAELMPEDKLKLIAALQQQGAIAMLGDGVNDAPALARADLGITLGAAGSAVALEVADVALMQDDLSKLTELITLSQRCAWVLQQNIAIALGLKLLFFGLTLSGHANLWMAVFADMGASLLVIFNGLRLLKNGNK